MNIFKFIEGLSKNQKILFSIILAVLILFLWFGFISNIEKKINKPVSVDSTSNTFDPLLCIEQNPIPKICQLRLDAIELMNTYRQIKERVVATNIEIWAPDDLQYLESIENEADDYFNKDLFFEAINSFNEAITIAETIFNKSSIVLNQFIDSGFNFLLLNNAIDAEISFRKALEIDPSNTMANKGLERSLVLDKVRNYINEANLQISVNSLDKAKNLIDEASRLDNQYQGLDKLRADIIELIKARDLNVLISDGFKDLKIQRFSDAKINFDKALLIDNNSKLALEGINLANVGIKKNIIEEEKALAYESLTLEDFSKASLHFQSILNSDPNIQFAILGLQEVKRFKELEFHLDRYINMPDRLSSPNVYEEALNVLNSSNLLNLQERLLSKKEQLEFLLTKFSKEINITLISDSNTQVSILNVGMIGVFNSKEIKLNPGKYTFIGKRKGFVTIRKVHDISSTATIKIQCMEKI